MSIETYQGSCHCGAVRYQVDVDLTQGTGRCNCSLCGKTRAWGVVVKPDAFKLLQGEEQLSHYQFATKSGDHMFCKTCGVRTFGRGYVEQIGGAFVSVQIMTLDIPDQELASLPIKFQDGRANNWWNEPAVKSHL